MKKLWNQYSYAIIFILLSFAFALILAIRFDAFQQNQYVKITVSEGDTLLKIADEYSEKETLSGEDFVQWVQNHNNIDEDHIFPGEKLIIPVKSGVPGPINEYASAAGD